MIKKVQNSPHHRMLVSLRGCIGIVMVSVGLSKCSLLHSRKKNHHSMIVDATGKNQDYKKKIPIFFNRFSDFRHSTPYTHPCKSHKPKKLILVLFIQPHHI